jgi:hypothetical protein
MPVTKSQSMKAHQIISKQKIAENGCLGHRLYKQKHRGQE